MAALPGVPLYRRSGFQEMEEVSVVQADGEVVPLVRMGRALDGVPADTAPPGGPSAVTGVRPGSFSGSVDPLNLA